MFTYQWNHSPSSYFLSGIFQSSKQRWQALLASQSFKKSYKLLASSLRQGLRLFTLLNKRIRNHTIEGSSVGKRMFAEDKGMHDYLRMSWFAFCLKSKDERTSETLALNSYRKQHKHSMNIECTTSSDPIKTQREWIEVSANFYPIWAGPRRLEHIYRKLS